MPSDSPLVTIAIPTYNRADGYLKNAIECAIAQDYKNIEIVISDNCSEDHTSELVASCMEQSSAIRYVRHEENIGANNNFNACLDEATGDYFLMLHDDDAIDPEFVSRCMSKLDTYTEPGLIRTGTKVVDSDGHTLHAIDNHMQVEQKVDFIDCWFNRKSAMYLCSTLFNTKALREAGGFSSPKNLLQDAFAEVKIAARYDVANIVEPLASFRVHAGELTHSARVIDWCEDSRALIKLICELFPEHRTRLLAEGNVFFSRLNYRRVDAIPWSIEKFKTYAAVARYFDNAAPASTQLVRVVKNKLLARVKALAS